METGAVAFDTHGFVKKLADAGMPLRQAEVLAEQNLVANKSLATKADLRAGLAELGGRIDLVKTKIEGVEARLGDLKWMLGVFTLIALVPAIGSFF